MHLILSVYHLLSCFCIGNRFDISSVKSLIQKLNVDSNITPFLSKIVWICVPLKVRVFLWEIVWRRLNTGDDVEKLNHHIYIYPLMIVLLCWSNEMTASCLIIHCPIVTLVIVAFKGCKHRWSESRLL